MSREKEHTVFASQLLARLGESRANIISHDSYYREIVGKSLGERAETNFDHPDALETSLMEKHAQQLKEGKAASVPVYDFATHLRTAEVVQLQPKPILILEGILIFTSRAIRDLCDLTVFVDADADVRLQRRILRDVAERGRSVADGACTAHVVSFYSPTPSPSCLKKLTLARLYAPPQMNHSRQCASST